MGFKFGVTQSWKFGTRTWRIRARSFQTAGHGRLGLKRTTARSLAGRSSLTGRFVQDAPDLLRGNLAVRADRLGEVADPQLLEQPRDLAELAVDGRRGGSSCEHAGGRRPRARGRAHAVAIDGGVAVQALQPPGGAAQVALDVGQPARRRSR